MKLARSAGVPGPRPARPPDLRAPKLVGASNQLEPVPFGSGFEPASRGWITRDRTAPGHIGDPRAATPEKGETLFRAFTDDVVRLLERILAWDGKSWA